MLIEERQPIESIGECAHTSRGTVKGLRKPDASVLITGDEFSTPDNDGLYSNFLKTKSMEDMPVPAKKQKKEKKKDVEEKGLARFMCK